MNFNFEISRLRRKDLKLIKKDAIFLFQNLIFSLLFVLFYFFGELV